MTKEKFQIKIESILGGISPLTHFAGEDQYRASIGINPYLPIADRMGIDLTPTTEDKLMGIMGLLRPAPSKKISGETITQTPMWMKDNPKDTYTYVYGSSGSVFAITYNFTVSAIADGGTMSGGSHATGNGASSANGMAYYDNYVYFAKNTTVARYGPLNGVPAFDGDYWGTTLGKTALTNTSYPRNSQLPVAYPNHVLHRHSDGILYIADVVDNQGYIHTIQTSKTTVEGDTDAGSTYLKLPFGYGLYPTVIESYGNSIAVALYENKVGPTNTGGRAKLAFWDTTSQNYNQMTWVEFPDPLISAMKNLNGILYIISGSDPTSGNYTNGFRLSRYIGGNTVEEVGIFTYAGFPPLAGGIDGSSDWLIFGTSTKVPANSACVYSYGLTARAMGTGMHNIVGASANSAGGNDMLVTALVLTSSPVFSYPAPYIGWTYLTGATSGVDVTANATTPAANFDYSVSPCYWWSKVYRIGQPFKITRLRIPLVKPVVDGVQITPAIYIDNGRTSTTATVINNTNYPSKQNINIRPENLTGNNNFWLELYWNGTKLSTVDLPITIEYELLEDDQ